MFVKSTCRRSRLANLTAIMIVTAILLSGLGGCDTPLGGDQPDGGDTSGGEDTTGIEDAPVYAYTGTVEVESTILTGAESYAARVFGNSDGTFIPAADAAARAIAGNAVLQIPDILKRYPELEIAERKSYSFSSFKLVADVLLKPSTFLGDAWNQKATLLTWGGDGSDLSNYIDLVSGEFVTSEPAETLYRTVYNSVLLQINAPAETIVPDFGSDTYPQTAFSWEQVKPYYSTNSSAAHVVYSTYVESPFVTWLGVKSDGWESLETVQEYYQRQVDDGQPEPHELTDFEDWAFNAPLNQEFFDEVANLNLTEDPHSGEAWLFMPLNQSIDLTGISTATFSVELYMTHLFEVFSDDEGQVYYMLGSAKNFRNAAGEYFFGPLPVRISYSENENGFPVDPAP
mgnify:CR=1 FL=1